MSRPWVSSSEPWSTRARPPIEHVADPDALERVQDRVGVERARLMAFSIRTSRSRSRSCGVSSCSSWTRGVALRVALDTGPARAGGRSRRPGARGGGWRSRARPCRSPSARSSSAACRAARELLLREAGAEPCRADQFACSSSSSLRYRLMSSALSLLIYCLSLRFHGAADPASLTRETAAGDRAPLQDARARRAARHCTRRRSAAPRSAASSSRSGSGSTASTRRAPSRGSSPRTSTPPWRP